MTDLRYNKYHRFGSRTVVPEIRPLDPSRGITHSITTLPEICSSVRHAWEPFTRGVRDLNGCFLRCGEPRQSTGCNFQMCKIKRLQKLITSIWKFMGRMFSIDKILGKREVFKSAPGPRVCMFIFQKVTLGTAHPLHSFARCLLPSSPFNSHLINPRLCRVLLPFRRSALRAGGQSIQSKPSQHQPQ